MSKNNDFLTFLKENNQETFIDVEGRRDKIQEFISKYNDKYNESIEIGD